MFKAITVLGTRPEAIKLAPVIKELRRFPHLLETKVLVTSQHRQMLDQVLEVFDILPEFDLNVMRSDQSLLDVTARVLAAIGPVLESERPDVVLVQGDTTSVLATALAAYYLDIPVGHVEAGLRTGDLRNPFPEELNRKATAIIARWHFCPTDRPRENLLREGIAASRIHVVGNTVVDALHHIRSTIEGIDPLSLSGIDFQRHRVITVTMHRRETFGVRQRAAFEAMREIVRRHPDVAIAFPVHRNPKVRSAVEEVLGGNDRIHLLEPLSYRDFVALLVRSHFILTDSGGIQEEAPSLGKPVLVMRDSTERPEGVEAGLALLVSTDQELILRSCSRLLDDPAFREKMVASKNPYGDGMAARRIVQILLAELPGR